MKTLKEAREERGIKQLAVAEAIGVSRQTYAAYEQDHQHMPLAKAEAACEFIGCNPHEIFFSHNDNSTVNPD